MRKYLFIVALITGIAFTAQAGYVVRGIPNANQHYNNITNFTLTLNNEEPVVAGSMHYSFGHGSGRNTIVIIGADPYFPNVHFPLTIGDDDEEFNVEVRDLHYDKDSDKYVLCGARKNDVISHAFVAEIYGSPLDLHYMEYPEADIFYSLCVPANSLLGYYVCGKSGSYGVIASVGRGNLQFTGFVITNNQWVCHKIIAKPDNSANPRFYVSGRNPGCSLVGFTMINLSLTSGTTYYWVKSSEPESLCVVADHNLDNTKIFLASSNQSVLTLYHVTIGTTPAISSYEYGFVGTQYTKYYVQDIRMPEMNVHIDPSISVAGFRTEYPSTSFAWYGETASSATTPMSCTDYSLLGGGNFKNYKIRDNPNGPLYTGGFFEDGMKTGAFFSLTNAAAPSYECDIFYRSEYPTYQPVLWNSIGVSIQNYSTDDTAPFSSTSATFDYNICKPFFKGGEAPKSVMSAEDEIEIITFPDFITLKNTLTNTDYQIYNVIGQLVQAGTTASDISTIKLGKGVYILRLETGKTLKFVK